MCDLFRPPGESRPLATAKAGRADDYKQLPFSEEGELAAAATLRIRKGGQWYGDTSGLPGPAAAVRHSSCFSRTIASLACRYLEIPRIGYSDDLGMRAPRALVH